MLHCEPLFACQRPAGSYSMLEAAEAEGSCMSLEAELERAGLPGCVGSRSQGRSTRFSRFSSQVALKELESSKQQLAAEACSFGSGKRREFALLTQTLRWKRPLYSSCTVLRKQSWKKVATCCSAACSKTVRHRQSRHPYARRLTGSGSDARRGARMSL